MPCRRLIAALFTIACAAAALAGAAAPSSSVIGGSVVQVQSAPWTVFVQQQVQGGGRFVCTGSIVDASHVLTAAHCVFDESGTEAAPGAMSVRAGISSFSAPLSTDLEQDRPVSEFRVHPGYVWSLKGGSDDVAVLALATPLDLSGPAVQSAALPAPGNVYPAGATVTIAGFGRQNPATPSGGSLNSMTATVDPQGSCGTGPGQVIPDDAVGLCAISTSSSTCSGDSGSGLVTTDPPHVIEGVVSAAPLGCPVGSHGYYVFTGAGEILSFIQGDDQPPRAPRQTATTVADLSWDPPLVAGNDIRCTSSNWDDQASLSYAFVNAANGQVIQQGPKGSLTLSAQDAGATIFCRVAATNSGGTAIAETGTAPAVRPAPQITIHRILAGSATRGSKLTVRVVFRAPLGLKGTFGVCVTPPAAIGRRVCSSLQHQQSGAGDGDNYSFVLSFRVKPTAPPGAARLSIAAVAGPSQAQATAVAHVARS